MGAYKALPTIGLNYVCVRQIPTNMTAQPPSAPTGATDLDRLASDVWWPLMSLALVGDYREI